MDIKRENVIELIQDSKLRSRLIEKGQENVKRFDSKIIANQYLQLYQEVYAKSQ